MNEKRGFGRAALLSTLVAGILLGAGGMALIGRSGSHEGHDHAAEKAATKYTCPMHPSIVADHPGSCPICGMDLVPMDGSSGDQPAAEGHAETAPGHAVVAIDPQRQQLIGLVTAEASRGPISSGLRTQGRVAVDETRVRRVNLKVGGFVEKLYVDFTGKPVRKGQPLFALYSPELLSMQNEFLLARETQALLAKGRAVAGSGDDLVEVARNRLRLWDVSEAQIRELERTGKPSKTLTIVSPVNGVVTKKDVVEGARLEAGAMPYEITDLANLWVLADAYEKDLGRIHVGQKATLSLTAFPNRSFEGEVAFVDPVLDPASRTAKVRLTFANPKGELKPEMFGEVKLRTESREALTIPADAVVATGTKQVVFVALDGGHFEPREVSIGESDGERTEVLEGLTGGEKVVTRANFLIDSESRLKASLAAMGH